MISRDDLPDTPDWSLPRVEPRAELTLSPLIELGEN